MKVPREASESRTETRRGNQRTNSCGEGKTSEDYREYSVGKVEEGDLSSCGIEPSTTALIPPWLRNSLGLAEKGDKKPNQKCLKIFSATNDQTPCAETGEMKANSDGDCFKCHFYIQDSPSTNPILEVNIGSEADFLQDAETAEKLSSPWRSKSNRQNQYESSTFGITKEREISRSMKSDVTSIDVVVPVEDQDEEQRKFRPRKAKSRVRRSSNCCFKSEDNLKVDGDAVCKSAGARDFSDDFLLHEPPSKAKYLDSRLLLLCGKKTIDNLTQDDVALLQEMKNQIGHKEGLEKLFNEIKESAFAERGATKEGRKSERKEEKEFRREATKDCDKTAYCICKSEENRAKNRMMDEERKLSDDGRKHHEKKTRNQQKQMKCIDEPEAEKEKKNEKCKCPGLRPREAHAEKEKKTKLRHCDYSVIEKVVSETLQKFIDLYRVQVPPDVISNMKKNIIQTLQSEYQETNGSRRGLDAVLAVQDQLKNAGVIKCSMHQLLMEERENKHNLFRMGDTGVRRLETSTNFTSEENVVSKDVPAEGGELDIASKMRESGDRDNGKTETLNVLRKDFERCIHLIEQQLDVNGTRLSSVILEKIGTEDKNLRVVHNFSNGVTECIQIYDRPNKGSPEGDNFNTIACDCQQNFKKTIVKRCQWSQTREKTYGKMSTQTDWVDVSLKHLMNADLNPGLYRITKANQSGRFYLTPEVLDDDDDVDEDNRIKRVSSEMCMRRGVGQVKCDFLKYASRETFVSEKGNHFGSARTLWRAFRSDCLGLNNLNGEALSKSKHSLIKIATEILDENGKAVKERKDAAMEKAGKVENEGGKTGKRDFVQDRKKDVTGEDTSDPDGYHRECVWLWNGKKMSPGIDLKVHVEDLLREKLNEMLCEGRVPEARDGVLQNESAAISNPNMAAAETETSAKNLEIRKTRAKFCIANEEGISSVSSPFIFSGVDSKTQAAEDLFGRTEEPAVGKSVREVGTQNSQHTIVSLNISKMKPRSKLCTMAKFSKRKQANKLQRATSKTLQTLHPFAGSAGEAKKVKLEFREENELASNGEKGSNTNSVRECFSIISNASSSSSDGPVRVKLIGIEVSKEKSPGDGDFCSGKSSETKGFVVEESHDAQRKYKHWEIIENVLNRVSQKEKDILWNDIRDFVKKKIGRDINDEGAREVCIEIEQDVPKFAKGKASHMVVARGNYTRNEGDVEVEVDLTLDDLERILRHRQKKMRRRRHSRSQKTESKVSSTSSDTITDYHMLKCRPFVGDGYNSNEQKILEDYN